MTRIPVHTVDSAPEGSRDALKALEAQFGMVLNIHGAMAHSPAVLETYVAIQSAQHKGTLDKQLREVVALAVAKVDECSYSQTAHTAGGMAAGLTEQETIDIRRGQVDDPKAQRARQPRPRASRERRPRAGHHLAGGPRRRRNDSELTETSAVVALNLFTNYFNHLVRTDLDLPPAPAL